MPKYRKRKPRDRMPEDYHVKIAVFFTLLIIAGFFFVFGYVFPPDPSKANPHPQARAKGI